MRTARTGAGRGGRFARRGMSLAEVIVAIVIMSGAMVFMARYIGQFQHTSSIAGDLSRASDLAMARIEQVKAYRIYSSIVATYNGVSETFSGDPEYNGFTRRTVAVICASCPTSTNNYTTVTVTVTGRSLVAPVAKTTIIAVF